MSEHLVVEHDFECSEKAFWDVFLDNDYNRAMFLGHLGFNRWEIVRFDQSEQAISRTVEVEPKVGPLPGPIKKVIGEKIGYREEGRLDLTKNRYELKVIPGLMAEKISVTGVQYTVALGEHRCRRVFDATITVKIFGVGSLIERQIAADMRKGYAVGAAYTEMHIAKHGIR
jgi:hypothetical protein